MVGEVIPIEWYGEPKLPYVLWFIDKLTKSFVVFVPKLKYDTKLEFIPILRWIPDGRETYSISHNDVRKAILCHRIGDKNAQVYGKVYYFNLDSVPLSKIRSCQYFIDLVVRAWGYGGKKYFFKNGKIERRAVICASKSFGFSPSGVENSLTSLQNSRKFGLYVDGIGVYVLLFDISQKDFRCVNAFVEAKVNERFDRYVKKKIIAVYKDYQPVFYNTGHFAGLLFIPITEPMKKVKCIRTFVVSDPRIQGCGLYSIESCYFIYCPESTLERTSTVLEKIQQNKAKQSAKQLANTGSRQLSKTNLTETKSVVRHIDNSSAKPIADENRLIVTGTTQQDLLSELVSNPKIKYAAIGVGLALLLNVIRGE